MKRVELIKEKIKRERINLMVKRAIAFAEIIILVCIFSLLVKIFGLTIF
jgi:hypothetical protein